VLNNIVSDIFNLTAANNFDKFQTRTVEMFRKLSVRVDRTRRLADGKDVHCRLAVVGNFLP
jgi:hypothetical protein